MYRFAVAATTILTASLLSQTTSAESDFWTEYSKKAAAGLVAPVDQVLPNRAEIQGIGEVLARTPVHPALTRIVSHWDGAIETHQPALSAITAKVILADESGNVSGVDQVLYSLRFDQPQRDGEQVRWVVLIDKQEVSTATRTIGERQVVATYELLLKQQGDQSRKYALTQIAKLD